MENQITDELSKKIDAVLEKIDVMQSCAEIKRAWIPAKELQLLLGYKATRFSSVIQKYNLEILEIGHNKFLSRASVEKMFKITSK